jgi:hypothetical protein
MVRALLAVVKLIQSVWVLELAGAGLIVAGCAVAWGLAVALLAAGGLCLLKAFDVSLEGRT